MALYISTRTIGSVIVVDCAGEIVLGEETASLRSFVTNLMGESDRIVLNLANVKRIDSNGIGTLLGLHAEAGKMGAAIRLAGLLNFVKSVLETTRLATFFEVFPTAEEAAASLATVIPAA